jgi:hypothetical protein
VISRRQALLSTLFGAGCVGLRSLATGLPAWLLLDPRAALAAPSTPACTGASKAQFVVFNTSGTGDPINASAPGTYEDPAIVHSPDPRMAPTTLTLAGRSHIAAAPWATLPQSALDRTVFWHLMTGTPVHPKEPQVLQLMGATRAGEMFPSVLAKQLAPCLGTIQPQPISVGAYTPAENLSYGGAALPVIPPTALKATLASPSGPLSALQPLRDATLDQINALYKAHGTAAQQRYLDSLATSQEQLRSVNRDLLAALDGIKDDGPAAQVLAAITLIRMKVSPVVAIHIPFGGDNHSDPGLAIETAETISGVSTLALLMQELASAGLEDQVTFLSLNVFGRTLGPGTAAGRQHNANHQVSIAMGKPFRGGVIGGVGPVDGDYGALAIDSKTGAGASGANIPASETLAAFGRTMVAAFGGDPSVIGGAGIVGAALA